jgi:Spy/CpxP family protein refolding chaperone
MRNKMRLSWRSFSAAIISIFALMLLTAMVVVSQGAGGPQGEFGFGPGPRGGFPFLRGLNLTDDQKAQIGKIAEALEANTKDLRDQMHALHQNETNLFTTPFDEGSVRAAAEARAKIEVELQVAHARAISQLGAILTTEQKAQLAARRPHRPEGPPPPSN